MTTPSDKLIATLLRLWDAGPRGFGVGGGACTPATLKNLRAHGCIIEESPGGGGGGGCIELQRVGLGCYRDLIEALAARHHWPIGRKAVVYHRTTSTNDVCWRQASTPRSDEGAAGVVAIADVQSRGRGRRGHTWTARPGQSVLMSILIYNAQAVGVDRLTLLAGLAGAEALESVLQTHGGAARHGLHAVHIKWPNDLLLAGIGGAGGGAARKVAGILVERRGPHAVVGIGVNVAQGPADFPPDLRPRATSLYMHTGQQFDRLRLIVALLEAFNHRCARITDNDAWIAQWKARCPMLGQQIRAREIAGRKSPGPASRDIVGLVQDIDPLHGLLVRDSSGALRWLAAQTTTLSA